MRAAQYADNRLGPHLVADDPLFAGLDALAPVEGANAVNGWAGMTIHRFCGAARLRRVEFGSLSVGFIASADDAVDRPLATHANGLV